MNEVLRINGVLCVNVLAGGHEALSGTFASRSVMMDDRFAQAEWTEMDNGTPALADALASFACGIEGVQEFGTHSVFICGVESLEIRERAEGLVYFGRSYHRLPLEQGYPFLPRTTVEKTFARAYLSLLSDRQEAA